MTASVAWTDQTAFEFAARKVIAQGRQSVDDERGCIYRGPDGIRCHVGWLIPDNEYRPKFDKGMNTGISRIAKFVPSLAGLNVECLRAFQQAHDFSCGNNFVADYAYRLRDVARIFGLDASFLDEIAPANVGE